MKTRTTTVHVASVEQLVAGGTELKWLARGDMTDLNGVSQPVSLVERALPPHGEEVWRAYHAAGMSVVSRGTYLMPDVKHDGSELYGKGGYGCRCRIAYVSERDLLLTDYLSH